MRGRVRAVHLLAAGAIAAALLAPFDAAGQLPVPASDSARILAGAQADAHRYRDLVRDHRRQGLTGIAALVRRERALLIEALDRAGEVLPGDRWIAGHRVGMRIKQGLAVEAAQAAGDCRAEPWWCRALEGLAFHAAGLIPEAEAAFESALDRAPPPVACGWRDLSDLLEGDLLDEYVGLRCEDRPALEARIWWLADPLHARPGNDRRTEHLARKVTLELHYELLALHDTTCPEMHRVAVMAVGWPEHHWSAEGGIVVDLPRSAAAALGSQPMQDAPGLSFVPPVAAVRAPLEVDRESHAPGRGKERYAPRYEPFAPIDHQLARFPRGDSMLVAAAVSRSWGGGQAGRPAHAALALSRSEARPPSVDGELGAGGGLEAAAVMVSGEPHLTSIEAVGALRGAGRARFPLLPIERSPWGVALSDPLLFEWAGDAARAGDAEENLDAVLPHMLGSTLLSEMRQVGLYWEVEGLEPGDHVTVSIRMIPESRGLLRRVGETLRLLSPRETVRLTWEEPPAGGRDGEEEAQPEAEAPAAHGDRARAAPGDGSRAAPGDGSRAAPGDGSRAAPGDGSRAAPRDGSRAAPAASSAPGVTGRSLRLDLSRLAPGAYTLEVEVTVQGKGSVKALRPLRAEG